MNGEGVNLNEWEAVERRALTRRRPERFEGQGAKANQLIGFSDPLDGRNELVKVRERPPLLVSCMRAYFQRTKKGFIWP